MEFHFPGRGQPVCTVVLQAVSIKLAIAPPEAMRGGPARAPDTNSLASTKSAR